MLPPWMVSILDATASPIVIPLVAVIERLPKTVIASNGPTRNELPVMVTSLPASVLVIVATRTAAARAGDAPSVMAPVAVSPPAKMMVPSGMPPELVFVGCMVIFAAVTPVVLIAPAVVSVKMTSCPAAEIAPENVIFPVVLAFKAEV